MKQIGFEEIMTENYSKFMKDKLYSERAISPKLG